MRTRPPSNPKNQHGSAILIILAIIGLGAAFLLVNALNKANQQTERDKITAAALAQAKEALIGYAATYRDSHSSSGPVFGYLPCPATDGNGSAAGSCGSKDVTLIGLLPWKTLGLPPLRDSSGECLWYAISGDFKNNPKTTLMNWDTAGQLIVNDAGGTTLASGVAVVIFSPHGVIGNQNRLPAAPTECNGNTTVANHLDGNDPIYAGVAPAAGASSTLTVATVTSIANGANNDQGLWITPDEIFKRIKQRSDFKAAAPNGDVNNLLTAAAACLNAQATLPAPITINFTNMAESTGVTVGSIVTGRIPQNFVNTNCPSITSWSASWNNWWVNGAAQTGKNFNDNWQDNLLYAKCPSGGNCLIVNSASCKGVVIFTGERTATQSRTTNVQKNTWDNYLESTVLSAFTAGGTNFTGAAAYAPATPSTDVLACIGGVIVGGTPITLNGATISAACSGCSGNGIDTGVTTLTLATSPALTITATGGTIGRNQGGESTDAIGVYQGGGAGNTALEAGESLSFSLVGYTARKFGITLFGFDAGEQAQLTFKNGGTTVSTSMATTATTANITPEGAFDEVVVQAVGTSAFWVQTVKFCDAVTSC